MAIEWMDNFSLYGTGTGVGNAAVARMRDGLYAETGIGVGIINDTDPSASGTVLELNGASARVRRVLSGTQDTVGMAFRLWIPTLPTTDLIRPLFTWRDGSNNPIITAVITTTGVIQVYRGTTLGTLLGATPAPVIVTNAWQHLEMKIIHSSTVGEVEIRVEGVQKLSLTAVNTSDTDSQQIRLDSSGTLFNIKDFVVWNGNGTYNTNFIGSVTVVSMLTSSDVALNWTPNFGSDGFSILDNSPPNDSRYISAGDPPPSPYQANLTNLPSDIVSVRALQTVVRARKSDGGDGNLQVSLESNAVLANGADRPITSAFTYWQDVFEEDPDTVAPWTPAAADAAILQLNRTV
jgi:hypothetical protein